MSAEFRLGIQSYCFRKFKGIDALIRALGSVNLPYVEIWPGHMDYNSERSEIEKNLAAIKDAGITVEAYGAVNFSKDEREAGKIFDFARFAGIQYLTVVSIEQAAIPMVDELSNEYGIRLGVHNHGTKFQFGYFSRLEKLFSGTSANIGLCLDAAWFLEAGEDPVKAVDVFSDRLYGVHLKDFTFDAEGNHQDVIIGTGGLDLPLFLEKLRGIGFDGYMSLEYEGNPDDPLPDVLTCLDAIKADLGKV